MSSYVLAFIGFVLLIVLHEAGHFAAAKAVGMRVEKFSLFFGPMIFKRTRGETTYGVGTIPLGGYVKISGMNPEEEFESPEIAARAYCNSAVWKRVVVIAAGPAMNIVLAFIFAWIFFFSGAHQLVSHTGVPLSTDTVYGVLPHSPADGVLRPGDRIVAIDGVRGNVATLRNQILSHTCVGDAQVDHCPAATPVKMLVRRDGHLLTLSIRPRWSAQYREMLVGFQFTPLTAPDGVGYSASQSTSLLWRATTTTFSDLAQIFRAKERRQLHSIVGVYAYTQEEFATGWANGMRILALVSLALAIMNLLPLLPLDGGHIFWALAEKLRGHRIAPIVVERASFAGIALIALLVVVVVSNDVSSLANGGFKLPQ